MNRKYFRWIVVLIAALLAVIIGFFVLPFSGKEYAGLVTDLMGKPLAGATVHVGNAVTKTDQNGQFKVRSLNPSLEITVDFEGESGSVILPNDGGAGTPNDGEATVVWGKPDLPTLFGDDDIQDIQDEITGGYFPKDPLIASSGGVVLPPGSVHITVPTLQEEPDLPPPVSIKDFVVNEEGREVVAGEILVGWSADISTTERASIIQKAGGTVRFDDPASATTLVYVADQKQVPQVVKSLEQSDNIAGALQNYRLYTEEAPNDPDYQDPAKSWWLKKLNAEPMWAVSQRGNTVLIAVIDAGFDFSHPDLQGVFTTTGLNYTAEDWTEGGSGDHGTHVSGIVAAVRNNGTGLMGVTNKVRIFPIKIYDMGRLPSVFSRLNTYSNIHIATMSMGWVWSKVNADRVSGGLRPYSQVYMKAESQELDKLIRPSFQEFYKRGGVMCKSAGNDYGLDASLNGMNFPETIVVGAGSADGSLTDFSNVGARVDIVAPGDSIWSTTLNRDYVFMNGTSMATPAVCGTVAAIRSMRPQYGALTIKRILRTSGKQPKALGKGYIYMDSWRALLRAVNMFGIEGDVLKGRFEPVKDATVSAESAGWRLLTTDEGAYVIPFLPLREVVLKASKDGLDGKERVQPPFPKNDVVKIVSIFLEDESTQETEETQVTQEPTQADTEEDGSQDDGSGDDGTSDGGSSDGTGDQGSGGGDGNDGDNTSGSDDGEDKPTGAFILENGIVINANGCAEGGYPALEKEVGGYRECDAGYYWSRDTIACEQKVCPAGGGRTYTLECKCPDGQKAATICGTNYVVACIPE